MRYCPRCGTETEASSCPRDGTPTVRKVAQGKNKLKVGDVVSGRYRILGELGRGGFGAVFDAVHTTTGHPVAVKVLAPLGNDDGQELARRFFQEAATTSRLSHPNTVRVYDFDQTEGGELYLVMERLQGETLQSILSRHQRQGTVMGEYEAVQIGDAVLRSLSEAHAHSLVHRDMKPANIFLHSTAGGETIVKVLDFGIVKDTDSRMTQAGKALGTPTHMSPEQAMGRPVDARADLYALAVVLYECLTGTLPYSGENPLAVVMQHVTEPIPPIALRAPGKVRPALAQVVERALAKRPEERWQTAQEMRQALGQAAGLMGETGAFRVPSGLHAQPSPPQQRAAPEFVRVEEEAPAPTPHASPVARPVPDVQLPSPIRLGPAPKDLSAQGTPLPTPAPQDRPFRKTVATRPPSGLTPREEPPAPTPVRLQTPAPPPLSQRPAAQPLPEPEPSPERERPDLDSGVTQFNANPWLGMGDDSGEPILEIGGDELEPELEFEPLPEPPLARRAPEQGGPIPRVSLEPPEPFLVRQNRPDPVAVPVPVPPAAPSVRHRPTMGPDGAGQGTFDPLSLLRRPLPMGGHPAFDPTLLAPGLMDPARMMQALAQMAQSGPQPGPSATGQRPLVSAMWLADDLRRAVYADPQHAVHAVDLGPLGQPPVCVLDLVDQIAVGRHEAMVEALAGSPDGRLVATAALDGQLRLWDASAGAQLREVQLDSSASALAFASDGKLLIAGCHDGTAVLLEVPSLAVRRVLRGHREPVTAVAAAGSRRLVVTAGEDGTVRTWDPVGGGARMTARSFEGAVGSVAITPSGQYVAAGGWDGRLLVWYGRTGELLKEFKAHDDVIAGVAMEKSGTLAATASDDKSVKVWHIPTGELRVERRDFRAGARLVTFGEDGQSAVAGSWDGTFRRMAIG